MNDPLPLPGHVWTLSTAVGYSFWTPERNFVFQSSTHSILILTPREKNPKPNQKQNKSPPRKKKTNPKAKEGRNASPQITTAALHLAIQEYFCDRLYILKILPNTNCMNVTS